MSRNCWEGYLQPAPPKPAPPGSDGGVRGEQKLVEMLEVQMGSSSSDYLTILGPII